ncbi:hypothetical protein HPB49_018686 [Dermacentor silvarum]|uniref:Uncharacterized protein n=1 Tax=Dermacentor silvarum TaxID=543639 RepID=A0ACB8CH05_DERSI|nr:hypothetical protein HPB49_018686 [Dermacentor silvarum]
MLVAGWFSRRLILAAPLAGTCPRGSLGVKSVQARDGAESGCGDEMQERLPAHTTLLQHRSYLPPIRDAPFSSALAPLYARHFRRRLLQAAGHFRASTVFQHLPKTNALKDGLVVTMTKQLTPTKAPVSPSLWAFPIRYSTAPVRDGSSWVVVVRDGAPRWPECTVATRRKNQRLVEDNVYSAANCPAGLRPDNSLLSCRAPVLKGSVALDQTTQQQFFDCLTFTRPYGSNTQFVKTLKRLPVTRYQLIAIFMPAYANSNRGAYCALSVAKLTNTFTPSLFEGTAEWVIKCQTYEGGFGGVPGMEAHGGYTFCGFAALVFLERETLCNMKKLLASSFYANLLFHRHARRWLVNRQMRFEGGFQGRTNKLVDGCYSFWQGGVFPLLHKVLSPWAMNP